MRVSKVSETLGFTLVELLIVGVIVSILGGVIIGVINVSALRARSRDAQRVADLNKIQVALETFFTDELSYPPNLGALVPDYITALPVDPSSGNLYFYNSDGEVYVLAADIEVSDVSDNHPCTSVFRWGSLGGGCSYIRCYGVGSPAN